MLSIEQIIQLSPLAIAFIQLTIEIIKAAE